MSYNYSSRFTSFALGDFSRALNSPPMADSTHLESGGGGSSRSSSLFENSPKQIGTVKRKPTSPLFGSKTNFKSSGNLTTAGLSRIDPQIYTDAQSRGLVNRLIKYHDKSQSTLNRSQSMTSLYTKPGQFPVVHLKKTEIKYSPRRNNSITSVRIAPPEKSVFQANTRSNILRAGSLLVPSEAPLKSRIQEDETDSENRVIAPTAEVESAPTKSVLDALKEISRKRINNEELDADRIKKQCKELSEVDSGGVGTKRARELPSSASPPLSSDQQLQKKRLCSKNNDISSSLSSSLVMNTPKRVEYVQPRPARLNVNQTSSSQVASTGSFDAAVAKGLRSDIMNTVEVRRAESSPLPQTIKPVADMQPPVVVKPQPKITLFNKKYDETLIRPITDEDQYEGDELGRRISFIKPKQKSPILNSDQITLKRVEKSKLSLILSCLSDDYNEEEEEDLPNETLSVINNDTTDAPPKVEEKKEEVSGPTLSGISALINNPIKNTGLGKIDPPNATFAENIKESSKPAGGFTFGLSASAKPAESSFSFGTPTKPLAPVDKPGDKASGGLSFGTTPSASAALVSKSDAPPAYSFPVSSQPPAISTSSLAVVTSSTTATPVTSNLISFSPAPVVKPAVEKSNFSLPPAVSTNTSGESTQSTITTTQSGISFDGGNGFSAFKAVSPTAPATATTVSTSLPSFGNIAASSAVSTNSSIVAGGFTGFGKDVAQKPAMTTANTFTFGGGADVKQPTASSMPTTATAVAPASSTAPVFGGFGNSTTTPTFGFGASSTAASTAPAFGTASSSATPAFGTTTASATPTFGTTTASAAPTFGTATASAAPSFGSKPFGVFGNGGTTTTAPPSFGANVTTNSTSVFGAGSSVTKPAANSPFSFGGASEVNTNNPAMGQSSNTFGFGAKTDAGSTSNVFGTSNGNSSNTFGSMAASGTSTFGTMASSNPPAFGAQAGGGTNSAASVFGAPNPGSASSGASGNGFGAAPVFGGGSSGVPSASSVFGGSMNTNSTASPFGTLSSNTAAPSGGIFGAAAVPSNSTSGNNNQSAPGASGAFTFGASSGQSAAPPAASATASKPFAFGQANNNSSLSAAAATPVKSNSFNFTAGSSASAASSNQLGVGASSSFSFGTPTNANNGNNAAAPAPAFGSNSTFSFSANTNNNNPSAISSSSNNNNQAMVKPFSFGGAAASQPQANAGGGMFGGGNAPSATPQPAFNFSSGSNASGAFGFNNAMSAPTPAGGPFAVPNGAAAAPMFSIGTVGNNGPPTRRPIRTATRRLKQ